MKMTHLLKKSVRKGLSCACHGMSASFTSFRQCEFIGIASTTHPKLSTHSIPRRQFSMRDDDSGGKPFTRKKATVVADTLNDEEFMKKAHDLFDRFKKAIEPILEANEYAFEGNHDESTLKSLQLKLLVGRKGAYTLTIDRERQYCVLQSPISGVVTYYYDTREKLWLGVNDRHDMRGLLTRDFIRHSIGLPNFD